MNEHSAYTVLPPLVHLLITHTSFMCQSNTFSRGLSFPVISRPVSSSFSSRHCLFQNTYLLIFYTPGHATLYSCAGCSLHTAIQSSGNVEAEIPLALRASVLVPSSPQEGGAFCNSPKGTVWAGGDPALASPHSGTQHPPQTDRAETHLSFLERARKERAVSPELGTEFSYVSI